MFQILFVQAQSDLCLLTPAIYINTDQAGVKEKMYGFKCRIGAGSVLFKKHTVLN